MCLVVDTCTFHAVFKSDDKKHAQFKPVTEWLSDGPGKLICGGSKYWEEINGRGVTRLLAELDRNGRLVKISNAAVDKRAKELKDKVPDADFDDEHILALIVLSKCCVVCTNDKRSYPYLRRKDLYPKGFKRPKIYSSSRNKDLCCNQNIVEACR